MCAIDDFLPGDIVRVKDGCTDSNGQHLPVFLRNALFRVVQFEPIKGKACYLLESHTFNQVYIPYQSLVKVAEDEFNE